MDGGAWRATVHGVAESDRLGGQLCRGRVARATAIVLTVPSSPHFRYFRPAHPGRGPGSASKASAEKEVICAHHS